MYPETPGGELKKRMQDKEKELRAGGRENWPIKIIETAGKSLKRALVGSDPFGANQFQDKKCLPNIKNNNKMSCKRNCICYKTICIICQKARRIGNEASIYFGETGRKHELQKQGTYQEI